MDPIVTIQNLSFLYPDGTPALKNLSLNIYSRECLALLGANGAGKSTLLLHFNGILQGQGRISVLGCTLEKKYLKHIRTKVGLVMQNPDDQLFLPTVKENVAFGLVNQGLPAAQIRDKVDSILERLGISHLAERFPYHLSLGEKKRAALASVLVSEPILLVLDEPTAGLDPGGRRELIELLKCLSGTKVLATHDLELAWLLAERTVILKRGEILADGPSLEVYKSPEFLEALNLLSYPCFLDCNRANPCKQ